MSNETQENCSNFEHKVTLDSLKAIWEAAEGGGLNSEFYVMLHGAIKDLSPDDRQIFLRGKRGKLKAGLWEGCRSNGYELFNASPVAVTLENMGFIKPGPRGTWIDIQTGKRITTKIRELGRLDWLRKADDEAKSWLKKNWPTIATYHLELFKFWIRENNPRSKEYEAQI